MLAQRIETLNRLQTDRSAVSTFLLSFSETDVSSLTGAARASPLRWESTLHAEHSDHRTIRSSTHEEGLCNSLDQEGFE